AEEQLADAVSKAANANLLAEKAREDAAKIERIYGWRRVPEDLKRNIACNLDSAKTELIVRIECPYDSESHHYANDIGAALQGAGVEHIRLATNTCLESIPYGLWIASEGNFKATALGQGFYASGIYYSEFKKDLSFPTLKVKGLSPNVYIYVGFKPWPSSLEYIDEKPDESGSA
ncbi:MAG: hypothetical protein ABUL58_05335, partial [Steroidobacter sp.]